MGIYSSSLRDHDRSSSRNFYTAEEIQLLREVHDRVLRQVMARKGDSAVEAEDRESNRVASAIIGLAQAGVTDPAIMEGMALHSLLSDGDARMPGEMRGSRRVARTPLKTAG